MFERTLSSFADRHALSPDARAEIKDIFERFAQEIGGSVAGTIDLSTDEAGAEEELRGPPEETLHPRYGDLGLLGSGGMGEVRRVRDRNLRRVLAMKVMRPNLLSRPGAFARFVEEAQIVAQLQHPGVLPLYDIGKLPDGRVFFTMKEIRGRTLSSVVAEVHAASPPDEWRPARSGWTFRRLVESFLRVCEAVSFAHDRGVLHRDLKPANVMVGEFGEVYVMDWGLAKIVGRPGSEEGGGDAPIGSDRSEDGSLMTRVGSVAGTPAYMPPEQARGEIDRIDARSDVWSLGATLYEILAGRPPYVGSASEVLRRIVRGDPIERPRGREIPPELQEALDGALAREIEDRLPEVESLAALVRVWLDGARKRERALEVVNSARTRAPEAIALRQRATALLAEAGALLRGVAPWEDEAKKRPGWAKEDEARALLREADLADLRVRQAFEGALRIDARLPEAHAALAGLHREAHAKAERDRNDEVAQREEVLLREHADALPEDHESRRRIAAYLTGDGALSLVTDPPGAEVLLHRYETDGRRQVAVFERSLGRTPLREVRLAMGSYLCEIRPPSGAAREHAIVRYPVFVGRGGHWDGIPPGGASSLVLWLPRIGELGPDDHYVPAGPFWSGGDREALNSLPQRRLWCDGFVIRRFPVTNREYLAFLDDLVRTGREEEADGFAPREHGGTIGERGAMIYGRDARGFFLREDGQGDRWLPDRPVLMVDWRGAAAFAAWEARRAGQTGPEAWRLPGELEWEKAARGVDGRFFPWGDFFDPSFALVRDSHQERMAPCAVEDRPLDESPCGVRGMAGNARDWCADAFDPAGPDVLDGRVKIREGPENAARVLRGGAWNLYYRLSRAANRGGDDPANRSGGLSFRLARPFQ